MSETSREVANLTETKHSHTPVHGVKEFVCLSVTKLDPNSLRTGKTEWAEIFSRTSMAKSHVSKKIWSGKVAGRAGAKGQNSNNYPEWPHSQGDMKLATQFHLYLIGCIYVMEKL